MKSFEIINREAPVERTHEGNNICIYAMNDRDAYCSFELLANCIAKKAKRLGYIDETKLYESQALKAITRDIRKRYGAEYGESFDMADDRSGRYELLEHIYEHVQAVLEYGN